MKLRLPVLLLLLFSLSVLFVHQLMTGPANADGNR